MNRLPSPFQGDLPCILNSSTPKSNTSSNSPGFLLMTRPPNASNNGSDRRRGVMQRGNYRHNYSRNNTPYSNNSKAFTPNRYQNRPGNYNNKGNYSYNNMQPSPFYRNKNVNDRDSSFGRNNQHINSASPSYQVNNSFTGKPHQNRHNFNNQNNHKTPLKDIPIDKFVSNNMIHNPWVEFDLDIDNFVHVNDVDNKPETANDDECVISADEISATDSISTVESPSGSPSTPYMLSEKETETEESDNANEFL